MDNNNPFQDALFENSMPNEFYASRTTQAHQQSQQQSFITTKNYIEGVLSSWNVHLGYLNYSTENNKTLKAILELVNWRQKDIGYRQKVKEDLNKIAFDRDKYRSLLEQAKRTIEQKDKTIGRLENSINESSNKNKKSEAVVKKQREEDKKMIAMLKSKNQQILHEVKKKQQQCHRITQQFKKNRTDRSTTVGGKVSNFEVLDRFLSPKGSFQDDKIQYLMQKADQQKKTFLRENLLLKQKLYDIRQQIVHFAQWIDQQLFGQTKVSYQNSFIINHNLLFRKQSVVQELKFMIQNAKNGIRQIQNSDHSPQEVPMVKQKSNGLLNSMNKKTKSNDIYCANSWSETTPKNNKEKDIILKQPSKPLHSPPTINKQLNKQWNQTHKVIQNTKQPIKKLMLDKTQSNKGQFRQTGIIKRVEIQFAGDEIEPIDQLMDDIEQSDLSIISHIEAKDISKKPYDKWDILFHND